LAAQGRMTVSPNPMVGCVIVKKGKILAEGWHKVCGGDHAEVDALRKAGIKTRGAVMYVTLEPCAHWGKTPPCVDAVIAAGIVRIVIAMTDPNPLTNGISIRKLKAAGVDVVVGIMEKESGDLNAAFIKYITKKMPYVTAKTAQTIDGKISTRTGASKWITSEEARAFARDKRNNFDAILVGIDTVLADDPALDAPAKRIKKIIVDSGLRIPEKAKLFEGVVPGQVIVAVTAGASMAKRCRLEKRGVRVLVCPAKNKHVDLKALFKRLAQRDIVRILIEGGALVAGSALKDGLVDELNVYIAPKIIGDAGAKSSVEGLNITQVSKTVNYQLSSMQRIGSDLFLTFKG